MNTCYGSDADALASLEKNNNREWCDLSGADLSHLDIDLDLEFVEIIGVNLEGALFKHGVRCGPFPEIGGWGCSAVVD